MSATRITTRTLVFDKGKILLVNNIGAGFWYPPGGGMEVGDKNLPDCAQREVAEETGLKVTVTSLAWLREFYDEEKKQMNIETYWIARLNSGEVRVVGHKDSDQNGEVEKYEWFTQKELKSMVVYPKIVHDVPFETIRNLSDRYIPS